MPEGDTVWRAAHRLDRALRGGVITRFELRVPQAATADLTGETVLSSTARGKHLLLRTSGGSILHTHLKMEGEWLVLHPGARWPKPAFRARAVIATARAEAIGFDLGLVELLPGTPEHPADDVAAVGYLGPDPLNDDPFDADAAAEALQRDPRAVHVAIQDQRTVAGFGNEYANELLFLRGLHPETPATEVDAAKLIALGARTIRANRDRPIRSFTGDTRRGRSDWVYGRGRQPCRRCGTLIETGMLGADPTRERTVFWCPRCQPAPR
ncbi:MULTISPECIES: DNA-formamidopyrimidine glycosylase family protein [Microbacterium]|uniref:DNA-formamidopyrimidine glycosylase family protein n=1 Tax=Microbacterium TaxID=33882 RepID=UPI001EF57CCD|nr:DNA-formamidopyrimidine glycosylase family protein [Microbacterium aurum]MCG7415593.1 Fpg/Nei family DNA glycosylase [Microbacterium aurum]